jgi:membrane protease YdiL (CAAX protease family)
MGTVWAALLSTAVFAAIHLDLTGFVPLFAVGLLLTWMFRRTGSIWGNIALHAIYNGVAVLGWVLS